MSSKRKAVWLDALDRAASLWRDDDEKGALRTIDEALAANPTQPLLRMQKYFMEKAVECRSSSPSIKLPERKPGDPRVSVIMTTYNRNTWLREAIDSVISQTFTDWELVLVNDGGDPSVEDIVISCGDSRLKYIWSEHKGRSPALNTGLRNARGEYFIFLDDDDIFFPEHLGKLVKTLDDNPDAPGCYSGVILTFQKPDGDGYVTRKRRKGDIFDFDRSELITNNRIPPVSLLVRRDGFVVHGSFSEGLKCSIDRDMWVRLTSDGDFIRVDGESCEVRSREDGSSISSDRSFNQTHFSNIVITMHKGLLFESKSLEVWCKNSAVRALKSLINDWSGFAEAIDLRSFFKVKKPYTYLLDLAKRRGAYAGDGTVERAAIRAAVKSAPYQISLWPKLITGIKIEGQR